LSAAHMVTRILCCCANLRMSFGALYWPFGALHWAHVSPHHLNG
jgi:hypothetical protein